MTYRIRSARWGNEDKTSAVILTDEVGHVAISALDTPEEWAAFQQWTKKNMVADARPKPRALTPQQKFDRLFARLGMTPAEFKTLLG